MKEEEILDNAEKLLNNSRQYAQVKHIFDLHKACEKVLVLVGKSKIDYVLDKYEEVVQQNVAKSGDQLVYISRQEFTDFMPSQTNLENKEVGSPNFEKAVEIEAVEIEAVENEIGGENPFEELPLVTEETKGEALESKPKRK
jgi:hypothetical protein